MAAARFAAVFVALLSIELSSQPAPQKNLTIQVTDITGAVIPGARIEIDPSSSRPRPILKTDGQGRAVVDLPAGTHTLSITAPGFKRWTRREVDAQGNGGQPVTARLELAEVGGLQIDSSPPDIPLGLPEPIYLPLRPLRQRNAGSRAKL